jgi:hypothetical protein
MITKFLNSKTGQIVISIILGLGLASLFRKVCQDNQCIIIKGPPLEEVNKYVYKIDDECYKYTPQSTKCA